MFCRELETETASLLVWLYAHYWRFPGTVHRENIQSVQ